MNASDTLRKWCLGVALCAFVGCGGEAPKSPAKTAKTASTADVHDHPSHGPHKGDLIELGSEEYHLEVVHDDAAETVTIYTLDAKAQVAVPIEATTLLVHAKRAGKPVQVEVAAVRQESDPAGKSSRFVAGKETGLGALLDEKGAEPKIAVVIDGKSFVGKVEHDHDDEHEKDHK